MQTLIIEIDSNARAKEPSSLLSSLDFVKKVSSIRKSKALIAILQDHENLKDSIVKRKNKAIARYL
jgi:exoribonuclease II